MKIPESVDIKKDGQYCINCFSKKIKRIFEQGRTHYQCENCESTNERSLVIDNAIKWWLDADNNYWHESVGVLIFNNKNEILCILRQISPFGYSIPAGHLEAGKSPAEEAQREVLEETGLHAAASQLHLVAEFNLHGDSCRRGSDDHRWHLYSFSAGESANLKVRLNDEAQSFEWLSEKQLAAESTVVFALRYILEHYGASVH